MTPRHVASVAKDLNATRAGRVQVALAVDLHAVRQPVAFAGQLGPDTPVGQPAVDVDVKHPDVGAHRVVDEELPLVQRKGQAVWLVEVVDQ